MSTPLRIGFYVHYHGMGHKNRTEAIMRSMALAVSPSPITYAVTSRAESMRWRLDPPPTIIDLPCDDDQVPDAGMQRRDDVDALHYAPLWTDTITRRVANYTAWLNQTRPDVMVVDVSSEISMLTRLASVPQIVMRQHGHRDDPGHRSAYQAAECLLAPFPECMEDDVTPEWVKNKTRYLHGFNRLPIEPTSTDDRRRRVVCVMVGRGGNALGNEALEQLAHAAEHYDVRVLGRSGDSQATNLTYRGWVDDVQSELANADVVLSSAGHNSVMELGGMRKRFVAVAEDRPFDEQQRKCEVLNREGLAVGLTKWPQTIDQWRDVIRRAERIDVSKWDAIYDGHGADEAAQIIVAFAERCRQAAGTTSTPTD